MLITYDPEADAIAIDLRDPVGAVMSKRLDERRVIDYDEAGNVVGLEFLFVSEGMSLDGVPDAADVAAALARASIATGSAATR